MCVCVDGLDGSIDEILSGSVAVSNECVEAVLEEEVGKES
jgi:hypothetical protein